VRDGFVEQDARGPITRWSAEAEQVFGSTREIPRDRDRCLAAGMDGYLSKPIGQRTLYDIVEE
jgi:CheY-like chemotaxis protein